MSNEQFWLWLVAFVFSMVVALDLVAQPAGEFYIEPGLVAKIYDESTAKNKEAETTSFSVTPMLGVLGAGEFTLHNRYFETDLRQLGPLPFGYLHLQKPLWQKDRTGMLSSFNIGYGYLQHSLTTENTSGSEMTDTATLQWLPVEFGLMAQMVFGKLKPSFDLGIARLWCHQEGRLDGFDQGFFTSYNYFGATVEMAFGKELGVLWQMHRVRSMAGTRVKLALWQMGVGLWLPI